MILFSSCVSGYTSTASEKLYGTWVNERMPIQKVVFTADGSAEYLHQSDDMPLAETKETVIREWSDSDGNIYYEVSGTATYQVISATFYGLIKLSKAATVLELTFKVPTGKELKNPVYPSEIDPTGDYYGIFYRAGN